MNDRSPADFDPEQFAANDRFVRALLRRFVSDPHLADDLAQETWLAALRQAQGRSGLGRAWLGTVARNFVLQTLRGNLRRTMREQAVARSLAVEADGSIHCDAELSQRVLAAVAALAEPYREVVRLRFFEDLLPMAIAERLQIPVETVRTRLRRGLQQLHGHLLGGGGAGPTR